MKRNYGLDIARIVAMSYVLLVHLLGQGGILKNAASSVSYSGFLFVEIITYCCVDIYGLLSGYLGYGKRKYNSYRVFELSCTVFFYSLIISILYCVFGTRYHFFSGIGLIKSILPFMDGNSYWYIMCYIPVAILAPYTNFLLEKISEKSHRLLCVWIIFLFSLVQSIFIKDVFYIRQGYSIVWLEALYIIGAYFKRTNTSIAKRNSLFLYFGCATLLWVINLFVHFVLKFNISLFMTYSSPIVLLMAVCVLMICKEIQIRNGFAAKLISQIAVVTFDVYIIHCHPVVFERIMNGCCVGLTKLPLLKAVVLLLLLNGAIYLLLTLIALLRWKLFKLLRLEYLWNIVTKGILSYAVEAQGDENR